MAAENHLIDYDVEVKKLNETLKKHVGVMGEVVQKYNDWVLPKLPSEYINQLNQVNTANEKIIASNKKVVESTKSMIEAKNTEVQKVLNTSSSIAKQKTKEADDDTKATRKKIQNSLDFSKAMEDQKQKTIETAQKEAEAAQKSADAKVKANEKQRLSDLQLQKAIEKKFDDFEKGLQKEAAAQEKLSNVYNKVQSKINGMTATYNNIATKKELGLTLTTREEAQLASLEKRLLRYNDVLKKVDAQVGKHQRNVGNYKSGWDGLGNSINQITREMPAFAVSAQTGFLALSNNIPILADEIQRVSNNVKELRAQGQQVPGVMAQILKSFLSWQTLLSVGVTLVTLYGKEIGEFFGEMFRGSKIISSTAKLLETYNKTLKDGDYEKAYKDVAKVAISFEQARKGVITKKDALKVYNGVLGDVMGRTNDFAKAETTLNNQARNYVEATMSKAQANILLSESAQLAAENVELQGNTEYSWAEIAKAYFQSGGPFRKFIDPFNEKVSENRTKRIKENTDQINSNKKAAEELVKKFQDLSKNLNFGTLFTDEEKDTKSKKDNTLRDRLQAEYEADKSILELEKANAVLQDDIHAKEIQLATLERDHKLKMVELEVKDKKTAAQQKIAIENEYATTIKGITDKMSDDYGDDFSEEFKKVTDMANNATDAFNGTKEAVDKLIARGKELGITDLKIEGISLKQGSKAYFKNQRDIIDAEFKKEEKLYEDNLEKLTEIGKQKKLRLAELDKEELEFVKNFNDQLKGILATSFDGLGFGSISLLFDEQVQEMWRMADETDNATAKMAIAFQVFGQIANDVFTKLKASSDAYYDNQYNQLEKEKETALKYAGENTAGREAIEEQYNARRLQLKRQQAKQEKEMAIFQAMINIATGVTSALAQAPPYSFILAALVGALGAVQIASIASQPLPAFCKGTQNAPEGWAIVDELRPEVHTDKHGKVKSMGSTGGANMRYLERGDKIFKSHADFFREMSPSYVDQFGGLHIENNGISANEMDAILGKHISKQPNQQTVIDENGFNTFVINGQNKTRVRNRRNKFNK